MAAKKNSLVGNINRRKKKGTSRPKRKSTISPEAYGEMQQGWPKAARKRKARKTKARKTKARKTKARKAK